MDIVDDLIWGTLRNAPSVALGADQKPLAIEVWRYRPSGVDEDHRVEVWSPFLVNDHWTCPVYIPGRTASPVGIRGSSPLAALIVAMRVVGLYLADWHGPGGELLSSDSILRRGVPVIDEDLDLGSGALSVRLWPPEPDPDSGDWRCRFEIEGSAAEILGVGSVNALHNAVRRIHDVLRSDPADWG